MIKLVQDTISKEDINELIKWLETYPQLTKSTKTKEFERAWSNWMGVKHSIFVNSGSSANLLMLYALIASKSLKNNKVVVPSLSWATDLSPVMQLGLEPILVDCNLDNLSVDLKDLEDIFLKETPSCLILVSVLGLPPDMTKIEDLCKKYDVILLEDACESLGTSYNGKKLGTFGKMSSFSLYFGHHISTIEGGMICTDDDDIADTLLQLRSHGWDRDLSESKQAELRNKWNIDSFSALYTFYIPGFNLRPTDLQAVIGLGQLNKIDEIISKRNENFLRYLNNLKDFTWTPKIEGNHFISNFCMPIIDVNKKEIIKGLMENNIECRPLICGSMGTQPFYTEVYGKNIKQNTSLIDKNGLYVPNHPHLTLDEIDRISEIIVNSIKNGK
jgi:CDP-4-dehydro-6-deoxyglucose reductase, E1